MSDMTERQMRKTQQLVVLLVEDLQLALKRDLDQNTEYDLKCALDHGLNAQRELSKRTSSDTWIT